MDNHLPFFLPFFSLDILDTHFEVLCVENLPCVSETDFKDSDSGDIRHVLITIYSYFSVRHRDRRGCLVLAAVRFSAVNSRSGIVLHCELT